MAKAITEKKSVDTKKKTEEKKEEPKAEEKKEEKPAESNQTSSLSQEDLTAISWDKETGLGYREEEAKSWTSRYNGKVKWMSEKNMGSQIKAFESIKPNATQRNSMKSYAVKSAIRGVGGLPANFIENTDPPPPEVPNGLGYHYLNTYIRNGQFIAFQPGYITWALNDEVIKLMTNSAEENKSGLLGIAKKAIAGGLDYNKPKLKEYWYEVSKHTRIAILLMGIEHMYLAAAYYGGGKKTTKYNSFMGGNQSEHILSFKDFDKTDLAKLGMGFANSVISGFPAIAGENDTDSGFVVFYVNGLVQASDSISNESEESGIAQALKSLMGDSSALVKEILSKSFGGNKFGQNVAAFLGGQPMMPNVWKDSSRNASYNVSIKLTSAAGDPVSVFMMIYQIIKLACLAVPLGTGGFYSSPPICRCYCQGVMNTNYALIENFEIERKMETVNDYGMPTEIDVTLSIRDLNPMMYREIEGFFLAGTSVSSSFTTFLATLCGVNITTLTRTQKLNITEQLKQAIWDNEGSLASKIDRFTQGWNDISEDVNYSISSAFRSVKMFGARLKGMFFDLPNVIQFVSPNSEKYYGGKSSTGQADFIDK